MSDSSDIPKTNQKVNSKTYTLTQCDLTVNGCDWHILVGNDERKYCIMLCDLLWVLKEIIRVTLTTETTMKGKEALGCSTPVFFHLLSKIRFCYSNYHLTNENRIPPSCYYLTPICNLFHKCIQLGVN